MTALPARPLNVAVVGGGWAGLAAAVKATLDGHRVTVFEASRHWGGRARTVACNTPHGPLQLDNGQHILIGAYTRTLALMQQVGVNPQDALLRLPLTLVNPAGVGLQFPYLPAPLDAAVGILGNPQWTIAEKWALLWRATRWAVNRFECPPHTTVSDLCAGLPTALIEQFLAPLCVSALSTPMQEASGQVFLTVLRDALFTGSGGSNLLIPRVPLGDLFPEPAVRWLVQQGTQCELGRRITDLHRDEHGWHLMGRTFDALIWANNQINTLIPLFTQKLVAIDSEPHTTLQHTAIATVYAQALNASSTWKLPLPMLALEETAEHPAQFVFDRGQLGNPPGLLAFVVSAASGSAADIERQVLQQGQAQLGLELAPVRTIVEKRATFACTPHAIRLKPNPANNLWLAGDEVDGPYPATLEGAVCSGWNAAGQLHAQARNTD